MLEAQGLWGVLLDRGESDDQRESPAGHRETALQSCCLIDSSNPDVPMNPSHPVVMINFVEHKINDVFSQITPIARNPCPVIVPR
jgi:hypothetical protein